MLVARRRDLSQQDIVLISAIGGESAKKILAEILSQENVINDLIEIMCLCGSKI